MTEQLAMFEAPPQPRAKRSEPERVYMAVLYLRSAGAKVYRAGRNDHLVDGVRVPTRALLQIAGSA